MANRICFLLGGKTANQQVTDKFLESFQKFNLSSQADVAFAFDSEKEQVEFLNKLKSLPKSVAEFDNITDLDDSGDLFAFDSPAQSTKPQPTQNLQIPKFQTDEIDDDDSGNVFFFLGDESKKSQKPKKSDTLSFADDELQKAVGDSFSFFPTTESNAESINPPQINENSLRLNQIVLPQKYRSGINGAGTFRARVFYALNQLKDKFDYIIVCESGNLIAKNVNLLRLCEDFFARKTLWGNEIVGTNRNVDWIKMSCTKWFANTLDWQKVLSPLYLWFNQPFIYRTDTLDEFFEVTGLLDNLTAIAWTDFPHYIYMYYLILYQGFKIRDIGIKANIGVCESNSLGNIKGKDPDFKPMLCKKSIQRHLDNENLFLVFGA